MYSVGKGFLTRHWWGITNTNGDSKAPEDGKCPSCGEDLVDHWWGGGRVSGDVCVLCGYRFTLK